MARRAASFTEGDVKRTIKATLAAGLTVTRVQVQLDGSIVVCTGMKEDKADSGLSEFDEWKAKKDARSAQGT